MVEMIDAVAGFVVDHPFVATAIVVALIFDFVNGFHDSANAIATVVATKVLTPAQALTMAAIFNFIGPFVFSLAVATTVGKDVIHTSGIDPAVLPGVIFGALTGAILWNLITWYVGLPSSSSHALIGGLVGAALAALGPAGVVMPTWEEFLGIGEFVALGLAGGLAVALVAYALSRARLPRPLLGPMGVAGAFGMAFLFWNSRAMPALDAKKIFEYGLTLTTMLFLGAVIGVVIWAASQQRMSLRLAGGFAVFGACVSLVIAVLSKALLLGGVTKTVLFMVVSPVLGFFSGFLLMSAVSWLALRRDPHLVHAGSKRAQLVSSAFYALTHGTNDAQKTMGIIAVLLIATGTVAGGAAFEVPTWVILTSAAAMGLGTLFGGWRIIKTMASRITHLTPIQGFAAETGGGVVLVGMAQAGIPVSTTHAITASIMGVGATKRTSAVRWGVGRRIVGAWIFTIPASAIVAFVSYYAVTPERLAWYRSNPAVLAVALVAAAIAIGL
ncbi:MAG TPA: inorganic phosphate transporter, partial [Candidatus Thermoplasmatota archaeon]|nr:inorganic phosphate transporter [Candidatus Thermoplasmatota archaeon]